VIYADSAVHESSSDDLERGEFYAIKQLVNYLPNGQQLKKEAS